MICFLTSRIDFPGTDQLNPANHFVRRLREHLPRPCRVLDLCSDPDAWEITDYYGARTKQSLENAGIPVEQFDTLDSRNEQQAAELVRDSDLLILAGGHVPTQNRFFQKIGLRALLRSFDGVLVGISAGSMNCAELVYAHPERPGEALNPGYSRFLPGLGLTRKMILPHYQDIREDVLDGLRVMEDIAYPDSCGRCFYLFVDGTYLLIENDGNETIFGEAYRLQNGKLTQISSSEATST